MKHTCSYETHRNEGTSLDGDISTACENSGQVKHSSYETHIQKVKLKIYLEMRQVQKPLPCKILKSG